MTRIKGYRGNHVGGGTANKYGAKKTTLDGITFDSKVESEYYAYLRLLQKAKEIESFIVHPVYELQPRTILPDRVTIVKPIDYTADFEIHYPDGRIEAADVKGGKVTESASVRMRMFQARHPHIPLRVIRKERGEWVTS